MRFTGKPFAIRTITPPQLTFSDFRTLVNNHTLPVSTKPCKYVGYVCNVDAYT